MDSFYLDLKTCDRSLSDLFRGLKGKEVKFSTNLEWLFFRLFIKDTDTTRCVLYR